MVVPFRLKEQARAAGIHRAFRKSLLCDCLCMPKSWWVSTVSAQALLEAELSRAARLAEQVTAWQLEQAQVMAVEPEAEADSQTQLAKRAQAGKATPPQHTASAEDRREQDCSTAAVQSEGTAGCGEQRAQGQPTTTLPFKFLGC